MLGSSPSMTIAVATRLVRPTSKAPHCVSAALPVKQERQPCGLPFAEFAAMERRSTTRLRSEEHTSELQSLMRISYAVFCLKKKTTHEKTINTIHTKTSTQQ